MSEPQIEKTHLTTEQETGIRRLTGMLPALASYYDPRDNEARDVCLVCGDCECGGACQGAMEVVRQIIDALGCGDDDWDWWRESFADDGVTIPPRTCVATDWYERPEVLDCSRCGAPDDEVAFCTLSPCPKQVIPPAPQCTDLDCSRSGRPCPYPNAGCPANGDYPSNPPAPSGGGHRG